MKLLRPTPTDEPVRLVARVVGSGEDRATVVLLDCSHSMILYGAGLSDANLHLYTDLPILVVGGGINGIKGGQHIRYPKRTPMGNLLLTMLDKANVPYVGRIGDSTGRLELPTV